MADTSPLRILLADDHVTVRHGLKLLVDGQSDMKVIAEASDGAAFDVRLVDEDDQAYDELLALGHRSVPVTVIGSAMVKGYDPAALLKALAAAD